MQRILRGWILGAAVLAWAGVSGAMDPPTYEEKWNAVASSTVPFGGRPDVAVDCIIDQYGNSIVTGYFTTSGSPRKYWYTVAYDPDGVYLDHILYNPNTLGDHEPHAIGGAWVFEVAQTTPTYFWIVGRSTQPDRGFDLTIIQYSLFLGDLTEEWVYLWNRDGVDGDDIGFHMSHGGGDYGYLVVATGSSESEYGDLDIVTVALDFGGQELFPPFLYNNGAADGDDAGVAAGWLSTSNGFRGVVATGYSSNGADDDIVTIAYENVDVNDWEEAWVQRLDTGEAERPTCVTTGPVGYIQPHAWIAGWTDTMIQTSGFEEEYEEEDFGGGPHEFGKNFIIVAYDAETGDPIWSQSNYHGARIWNGTASGDDIPYAIDLVVAQFDDGLFVAGSSDSRADSATGPLTGLDYRVLRFHPSDGDLHEDWVGGAKRYNSGRKDVQGGTDEAFALGADVNRLSYLTGRAWRTVGNQTTFDMMTCRFFADGAFDQGQGLTWFEMAFFAGTASGSSDAALAMDLPDSGYATDPDVLVTGTTVDSGQSNNYRTIMYWLPTE